MNRLGLKISCFVVSVIIWVQVASTADVEQSTDLPLRLTGVAEGLTAAGSDLPGEVKVRVQGSKLRLMLHSYFNRYVGEVRVNVSDRAAGPTFSYELDQNDVFTDLVVVGIQPPVRLRIKLDEKVRRKMPVRLVTTGSLPTGRGFLVPPTTQPDSVMVTGPARFFPENGRGVRTEAVDLARTGESVTRGVALQPLHEHLVMVPREVRVSLQVAAVEDRTLANIPVIPLVDAGQPEVGISPPVVDVMVRGVADSVRALQGDRVLVTVPVGALQVGVHMVPGQVSLPDWASLIGIDPPDLQVVVGRVEPVYADSLRLAPEWPDE